MADWHPVDEPPPVYGTFWVATDVAPVARIARYDGGEWLDPCFDETPYPDRITHWHELNAPDVNLTRKADE